MFSISPTSCSIGGFSTSIHLTTPLCKTLTVILDAGSTAGLSSLPITHPKQCSNPLIFLSHGHVDHTSGLWGFARAWGMANGNKTLTVYVPEGLKEQFERVRDAVDSLDGKFDSLPPPPKETSFSNGEKSTRKPKPGLSETIQFTGLLPGTTTPIPDVRLDDGSTLEVRTFATNHCEADGGVWDGSASSKPRSLGYVFVCREKKKLKSPFNSLPKNEIHSAIKTHGVDNVYESESERGVVPAFTYTGDCHGDYLVEQSEERGGEGWQNYKNIFNPKTAATELTESTFALLTQSNINRQTGFLAPLYLCELTYIERGEQWRNYAWAWQHVCIDGVEDIFRSNGWWKVESEERKLVFFHLSNRYREGRFRARVFVLVGG